MSWKFKEMLLKKNFKKYFLKEELSLYTLIHSITNFKENIDGVGYRMKPRIRWYESVYGKNNAKKNIYF